MMLLRIWMGFFFALVIGFACTSVSASSQKLLDDLAKSPSVQAAQPIIDALWKEWINEHQSQDEQALMTSGMAAMGQGRLKDCLLYTSPSPRDVEESRMPSSA